MNKTNVIKHSKGIQRRNNNLKNNSQLTKRGNKKIKGLSRTHLTKRPLTLAFQEEDYLAEWKLNLDKKCIYLHIYLIIEKGELGLLKSSFFNQ